MSTKNRPPSAIVPANPVKAALPACRAILPYCFSDSRPRNRPMKIPLRCATTLCIALLAFGQTASAAKEGYYRWQDGEGEVHFTQQPPRGQQYQFIETKGGAAYQPAPRLDENDAENEQTQASPGDTAPKKMEVLPPKDPAICAQARSNMQRLQLNGARIRVTEADGSSRLLNQEEIATQRERAQEAIKLHCEN